MIGNYDSPHLSRDALRRSWGSWGRSRRQSQKIETKNKIGVRAPPLDLGRMTHRQHPYGAFSDADAEARKIPRGYLLSDILSERTWSFSGRTLSVINNNFAVPDQGCDPGRRQYV